MSDRLAPQQKEKVLLLLWRQAGLTWCPLCGVTGSHVLVREARLANGQVLEDRTCEGCLADGRLAEVGEVQPLGPLPPRGKPAEQPLEDATVYLRRMAEQRRLWETQNKWSLALNEAVRAQARADQLLERAEALHASMGPGLLARLGRAVWRWVAGVLP